MSPCSAHAYATPDLRHEANFSLAGISLAEILYMYNFFKSKIVLEKVPENQLLFLRLFYYSGVLAS